MRGITWAMQHPEEKGLCICIVAGHYVFFRSAVGYWQERRYSIAADADATAQLLTANWEYMGLRITGGPVEFVAPDEAQAITEQYRTVIGRLAERALINGEAYAVV